MTIQLVNLDDAVVLDIHDDGAGFDPAAPRNGHFGLRLLESLARDAGASLAITSSMGCGTDVQLRIDGQP